MRRRLLLSYLALTVVVLLLLEVPLGALEARQEHDALAATARRDATALAVLAAEELEQPGQHDLVALASRYRAQAGSEVAIMNASGQIMVALDPDEPDDGSTELVPVMRRALDGEARTSRRADEGQDQLVAVLPMRSGSQIIGAVAVSVPAGSTDRRIFRAWLALALLAVVLVGVACGIGLVLARSLTAPLTTLQDAAERLGGGELTARAPPGGPREVATLSDEFNRMADQLAGLVQGQRRFVADASHQLRTPLTSLRLRLENLAASPAGAEIEDAIDDCEAEVDRLGRLVDGLLALSRAEGKPPSGVAADVGAVALERAQSWSALAEERDVELQVEQEDARTIGAIDPEHLEQVLDNLLANALEASPPGGLISISIGRAPKRVVLRVRDEGPGLSDEDLSRAFDRFWQGSNGANGSSGLGLSIVRELVSATGGSVTLAPAPSHGLDAIVSLPTARQGATGRN